MCWTHSNKYKHSTCTTSLPVPLAPPLNTTSYYFQSLSSDDSSRTKPPPSTRSAADPSSSRMPVPAPPPPSPPPPPDAPASTHASFAGGSPPVRPATAPRSRLLRICASHARTCVDTRIQRSTPPQQLTLAAATLSSYITTKCSSSECCRGPPAAPPAAGCSTSTTGRRTSSACSCATPSLTSCRATALPSRVRYYTPASSQTCSARAPRAQGSAGPRTRRGHDHVPPRGARTPARARAHARVKKHVTQAASARAAAAAAAAVRACVNLCTLCARSATPTHLEHARTREALGKAPSLPRALVARRKVNGGLASALGHCGAHTRRRQRPLIIHTHSSSRPALRGGLTHTHVPPTCSTPGTRPDLRATRRESVAAGGSARHARPVRVRARKRTLKRAQHLHRSHYADAVDARRVVGPEQQRRERALAPARGIRVRQ
jgi:hypothetical protein